MSIWRRRLRTTFWIALRRSKTDKRARLLVLTAGFWFLYFLSLVTGEIYLWYATRTGFWVVPFYGVLFGSAGVAFLIIRKSHRRQAKAFRNSITGRNADVRPMADEPPATIRNYLADRALIIAALVSRAASEIYLQHREVPSGSQIVTRQTVNQKLRQGGLWDKLEPDELSLLIAADGHWTAEQQNEYPIWCERLRLLRWTLKIDDELVPLAHFPKSDVSLSRDILSDRELPFKPEQVLRPWDVRVERDIASEYVIRVVAELQTRGLLTGGAELGSWAYDVQNQFAGPAHFAGHPGA